MSIYADAAYRMGLTHEVCQDYAAAGAAAAAAGVTVAALSDGCSSEADTDIGARALVRSAVRLLSLAPYTPTLSIAKLVVDDAIQSATGFSAKRGSVYATLMTIIHNPEGTWKIMCWGDGIVGYRSPDGLVHVTMITWPDDAPYYPIYVFRDGEPSVRASITRFIFYPGGEVDISKPERMESLVYSESLALGSADFVFVGSDGWCQFDQRDELGRIQQIDFPDVFARFLSFKGGGPSFIRRRLAAFLRSASRSQPWRHRDDLSLAAIYDGGES